MPNTAPVYLIDGARTPFLKAQSGPGPCMASDLALASSQALLLRYPQLSAHIKQSIWGCVMPDPHEVNIARQIALRLGLPIKTPAFTVQRNCASGMQAIACGMDAIQHGDDLVLCGGVEAMSHAPVLWSKPLVSWLGQWRASRGVAAKLKHLSCFRLGALAPRIALRDGLTDRFAGMNMGQTAEYLAAEFGVSREQMDAYALQSHERVAQAWQHMPEIHDIAALMGAQEAAITQDTGVRTDSDLAQLARLKPMFEPPCGHVTAGNSAQITDGAVAMLLASESAVKRYDLPVLAQIKAVQWSGCQPQAMGLGPVFASTRLLQRVGLGVSDIDLWELNEAFAVQVLACLAAWQDASFCRQYLGLNNPMGAIDPSVLNMAGGAIAMGHPVGASGARIVLQCAQLLKKHQKRRGIATMCIGGGQGGAMLIERAEEASRG